MRLSDSPQSFSLTFTLNYAYIPFSTISENMVDDYGTHADFFYLWDGVEANDLAAQWFGSLLTPRSWEHAWLNNPAAVHVEHAQMTRAEREGHIAGFPGFETDALESFELHHGSRH